MTITADLADVKQALRVAHDHDDDLLIRLIGSAIGECVDFLDSAELAGEPALTLPEQVFQGIVLMVQADYEGDPLKRNEARKVAEALWMPYREGFGL